MFLIPSLLFHTIYIMYFPPIYFPYSFHFILFYHFFLLVFFFLSAFSVSWWDCYRRKMERSPPEGRAKKLNVWWRVTGVFQLRKPRGLFLFLPTHLEINPSEIGARTMLRKGGKKTMFYDYNASYIFFVTNRFDY